MAKAEGLEKLLTDELQDLYDAEKQLVKALPKIAKACTDEELASAFQQHLEVTKGQVQRLEQVFQSMGAKAKSKPCKAMKGLVEEGQELIQEEEEEALLDVALIGAGRKVEHYEMMGYESARMVALQLGMKDAAQLLQETMREEMEADKQLSGLTKRLLKEAQQGSAMGEQEEKSTGRAKGKAKTRASSGGAKGKSGNQLTDHEEIRQWAEERGARPACVRGTGDSGDTGMIRLDFPGYSGEDSLEEISWDDWFEKFDENNLALIVQDTVSGGKQKSNFNKLVSRTSAEQPPKVRTAR
jgi:ferritin-like metal-binding protein YciE